VGGRGYLSTRDTSPFVGAGLGVLRLEASDGSYPEPGEDRWGGSMNDRPAVRVDPRPAGATRAEPTGVPPPYPASDFRRDLKTGSVDAGALQVV